MEVDVKLTMRVRILHDEGEPEPGSAEAAAWLGRFTEWLKPQLGVPQTLSARRYAIQNIEAWEVRPV